MKKTTPVAERMRPIIQAMERSISAARERRLRTDGVETQPNVPAEPAPTEYGRETPPQTDKPLRARARPKPMMPPSGP